MDELLREVQAEKEYILDTLRILNEVFQRKEKTAIELAALQNIYNGIENILKRVLKFKKSLFIFQNRGTKI